MYPVINMNERVGKTRDIISAQKKIYYVNYFVHSTQLIIYNSLFTYPEFHKETA